MNTNILRTLACVTALSATTAAADTYIMTVDAPLEGISGGLYQSVNVTPLGTFTAQGVHYVVLDAPSEIYVETLFSVYGTWPLAMNMIETDWEAFSQLSSEMKLPSLQPVFCRFCIG